MGCVPWEFDLLVQAGEDRLLPSFQGCSVVATDLFLVVMFPIPWIG